MGRVSEFVERLKLWTLISLGWLATVLFFGGAVNSALDRLWYLAVGFLIVAAAACPKAPIPANWRVKAVVGSFVFLFLGVGIDSPKINARHASERQAEQAEQAEAEREALEQAFQAERAGVLSAMEAALTGGDYIPALQAAARFRDVADESFMETFNALEERLEAERRAAREANLVARVRTVPASDREQNRDLYRELLQLDPDNAHYRERFSHYDGLIRADERARADRVARFGQPPTKGSWDGSYRVVTQYLRDIANDPGSIDVDACTDVYHVPRGWLVGCDYRGANAFGGLIRASNWFIIQHDRVVAMEDASAYNP